MDPSTLAMLSMGSKVLGQAAAAEAGPVSSGISNSGFFGLGNEGMSVNYGGSGLNLQGGAGSIPSWVWIAGAGLALYLLWD